MKETVDEDVKVYCIFDSDFHTTQEIQLRNDEAKKIGVNIHIWRKKEIENYLIVPTAILRKLKESSKEALHLTVNDVEKVIEGSAKEMEEDLIDKLADSIQKQNRKLSVSVTRKEAKSNIDRLENRICGKDLISSLSKWSQENYKVSLNPNKLANNLQINEIDA